MSWMAHLELRSDDLTDLFLLLEAVAAGGNTSPSQEFRSDPEIILVWMFGLTGLIETGLSTLKPSRLPF